MKELQSKIADEIAEVRHELSRYGQVNTNDKDVVPGFLREYGVLQGKEAAFKKVLDMIEEIPIDDKKKKKKK